MTAPHPIVIGAGPAGSAAAIHLLRGGALPLVIERRRIPGDALCGGFLSWRTLELLDDIGISRAMLGGHEVTRLRIVTGQDEHTIALPLPAMGVSRRHLDHLLLTRAREMGAAVRYGAVRYENGRIHLDDGTVLAGESIFVATGKHDLRGLPRPRQAAGSDPMTGLRWRLAPQARLRSALSDHIEIHLFDRGYAGLILHEDGSANLCIAIRKSWLAEASGDPAALMAQLAEASPSLAERRAFPADDTPFDAIGHIPYNWRATTGQAGIFRLGDQAGVIASLAGEGIGIALASAAEAARCFHADGAAAAPAFQARFAARLRRPMNAARIVAALGQNRAGRWALTRLSGIPGALAWAASMTRI